MRQIASGIVAIIILTVVLAWVSALAFSSFSGNVEYLDSDGNPHLRFIWRALVWFVTEGDLIGKIFSGLVALVGVASQILAQLHKRVWTVVAVSLLCILGIIACIIVIVIMSEPGGAVISTLRGAVGGDEAALQSSIQIFMGLIIAWFGTFMGTQLGISVRAPTGALRWLLDRYRGGGNE